MTAYPIFPAALPVGFSLKRMPLTSTRVAKHVSGRSVRRSNFLYPLFQFELLFEALHSGAGLGGIPASSFQTFQGFFANLLGQAGLFCYADPLDKTATAQILGITDGVTTVWPALWTVGSVGIPVGQIDTLSAVYLGGTVVSSSSYAISGDGTSIVFTTPPGAGQTLTASYDWYFLCAFDEDTMDFEQFFANLWAAKSVKFTSVKL